MVAAAVLPHPAISSSTRVLAGLFAVVLAFLVWRSDYRDRPKQTSADRAGRSEAVGRRAGRVVGQGVQAWRRSRNS
jgi:hypothetical protein